MVGAMNVSLLLEQQVQTCRTYKMKGTHAQEKLNKKDRILLPGSIPSVTPSLTSAGPEGQEHLC